MPICNFVIPETVEKIEKARIMLTKGILPPQDTLPSKPKKIR
jgi:hypothetical protein